MTRVVGIDPGLGGAVAVLPDALVFDTPVGVIGRGKSNKRDYIEAAMADLLRPYADGGAIVVIEQQQAFPGQGRSSTFSTGKGYGTWLGILAGLQLPYEIVHPSVWKRAMMGGASGKDAARLRAIRLFPSLAAQLAR